MKGYERSGFGHALSLSGINPQDFPASIWQQGHFFELFHFLNLGLEYIQTQSSKSLGIYSVEQGKPLNKRAKFNGNTLNQTAGAMT